MVGRINDVDPYKNVQSHVIPGGRIQHLTQVLQNYRRKDCTKLKNVIIIFGLNDVLQRKGTVFLLVEICRTVSYWLRGYSVVLRSTTQGSITHMQLTLCTHLMSE